MKKIFLIVLLLIASTAYSLDVVPKITGAAATDSIYIPIIVNRADTTLIYTAMNLAGGDAITILIYGPDNNVYINETNSANIVKLANGIYEARYKASDASNRTGLYRVFVTVQLGTLYTAGDASSYYVMPKNLGKYLFDLESYAWFSGAIPGATQTWWTSPVGANTVTDSIVVTDSLDVRKRVVHFYRSPGSAVITTIETE